MSLEVLAPKGQLVIVFEWGEVVLDVVLINIELDALHEKLPGEKLSVAFLGEVLKLAAMPDDAAISDAYVVYHTARRAYADFQKALDGLLKSPTTTA